jgi:ubiquinone/menaquinone biosynthesis C-methylase UbiE
MEGGTVRKQYAAGYDPIVLQGLSRRNLQEEAAFFLPHLRPDMRLLDCGCGPGALTVQLAQRLSRGVAVGIDQHGDQLQRGRDRAEREGLSNVEFKEADIYSLPFGDASFDAVFAHAILYHLNDPEAALAEIRRVLRPGGVLGIRDSDLGGDVVYPKSPLLEQAWALMERTLVHHGAAVEFGRTHRAVLRRIGFRDIRASASYDPFGTPDRVRGWSAYCRYFLMDLHLATIVTEGWASLGEVEEMAASLQAWGENPDAFYARCRCEDVGWNPLLLLRSTMTPASAPRSLPVF